MLGNRRNWATLLPLIQAFVNGSEIEKQDYRGRWVATDELHNLLSGVKFRIKKDSISGHWERSFLRKKDNNFNEVGIITIDGSNNDDICWPKDTGLEFTSLPVFVPKESKEKCSNCEMPVPPGCNGEFLSDGKACVLNTDGNA